MTLKLMRRPPLTVFNSASLLPWSSVCGAGAIDVFLGVRGGCWRRFTASAAGCARADGPRHDVYGVHTSRRDGVDNNYKRRFSNLSTRHLAHVRDERSINDIIYFTSTPTYLHDSKGNDQGGFGLGDGRKPPDERTLKLGKTIQTLHTHLPHLLTSPLPQEILSPSITLHLFPSTHPHLPTVSGKIAYNAALWTAPVAWGRVPVVGNVKLIVLSERMVKNGGVYENMDRNWGFGSGEDEDRGGAGVRNEKLIVRWRTCGKSSRPRFTLTPPLLNLLGVANAPSSSSPSSTSSPSTTSSASTPSSSGTSFFSPSQAEFEGLFIFDFDSHGRIVKHVIEHAQEGRNWDGMPRVISVTDWLLGLARGRARSQEEEMAGLAWSGGCADVEGESEDGNTGARGGVEGVEEGGRGSEGREFVSV